LRERTVARHIAAIPCRGKGAVGSALSIRGANGACDSPAREVAGLKTAIDNLSAQIRRGRPEYDSQQTSESNFRAHATPPQTDDVARRYAFTFYEVIANTPRNNRLGPFKMDKTTLCVKRFL
jgi:hypothetical protein